MLRCLIGLLLLALPARADRLRVVVAVRDDLSGKTALFARAELIAAWPSLSHVEEWGDGPAFEAEIERERLEELSRDPRVRAISIDEGGTAALRESIPLIGADVPAALGFDGGGTTVAIIDSGIEASHPAFGGRVVAEECFCDKGNGTGCCPGAAQQASGTGAAADDNGHGTHVAGIVGANGTVAPRGVAPGVRLVAVKVLDGEAKFYKTTEIYRALEWVAQNRPDVRVVNMSLGTFDLMTPDECAESALTIGFAPLVQQLRERGVLITASSGNQSSSTETTFPACMDGVLAVGAVYDAPGNYTAFCSAPGATADQMACFTNSSASLDVLAPGAPILSAWPGSSTRTLYGTSMAAPHVAGLIAMMLQASGGALTAPEIEAILRSTGKTITDARNGLSFSRIDAAAAIAITPRPPRKRAVRH